ncbi:phosphatase PAP2 family protein [Crocinitomix catalasitica]|uniref:phosphatase PAP2 family protein n=1 Tax=Crocinitomix catalasitica TaxID=184607 RepID=UPI000569881A|nr:phosphatase PAP2 family protein [Crocinitomix catalasitica]
MKNILFPLLLILSIHSFGMNTTKRDSTKTGKQYVSVIIAPIALSLLSVDLMRDSIKYGLQKVFRSRVDEDFHTGIDDWIHYAPVVMMYAADLFKVPAKNTVWNQTKYLIFSEAITAGIVWGLKYSLKIQRPNNGAFNAYPSGHTSQAFVQSQVLYNEFRETAPLLAASGFLFSISTGTIRILNNKHWVPDVLLGAGIAMLVTNTIYHFEPLKNWNPFKNLKEKQLDLTFMPQLNPDYMGGYFSLRF